jgi:PhzF family phenazine biosynthesis protein
MDVQRYAAFSDGEAGGNPAGVVVGEALPDPATMQAVAAEVGYSETAFAAPLGESWRVRYFAPEMEIPFCGHATVALGAALALRCGDGVFALQLNDAAITVEGRSDGGVLRAALQSPQTQSRAAPAEAAAGALALFSYRPDDLDLALPLSIANAGVDHLVLALKSREALAAMRYDLDAGRAFMTGLGVATVSLVFAETPRLFHARNPFAAGGVYEDPATGAGAAALGGLLRDLGWPHGGEIEIRQGEDMGAPSRLRAEIPPERGASIRVSGTVRRL